LALRLGWSNVLGRVALSDSSRPNIRAWLPIRDEPPPIAADNDLVAINVRLVAGPAMGVGE
jgi:hypothetical protein